MGLFDWITLGKAASGDGLGQFSGSFSVTIGDIVQGKYGAQHEHMLGSKILMVCDPLSMLGGAGGFMPILGGLVTGVGGNFSLNYASVFTGTYVGPKIEVRRAPTLSKVSDNVLARTKVEVGGAMQESDEIDQATSAAAAVLSLLIVATTAALELAMHFAYPKFGSTSPDDQAAIAGYGKTPDVLKVCSYMIPSRLMALLKVLEIKGSYADFAQQFLLEGRFALLTTSFVAGLFVPPVMLITLALCKGDEDMFDAIANAKQALTDAGK
jgi:hypothetical protein